MQTYLPVKASLEWEYQADHVFYSTSLCHSLEDTPPIRLLRVSQHWHLASLFVPDMVTSRRNLSGLNGTSIRIYSPCALPVSTDDQCRTAHAHSKYRSERLQWEWTFFHLLFVPQTDNNPRLRQVAVSRSPVKGAMDNYAYARDAQRIISTALSTKVKVSCRKLSDHAIEAGVARFCSAHLPQPGSPDWTWIELA